MKLQVAIVLAACSAPPPVEPAGASLHEQCAATNAKFVLERAGD